MPPNWAAEVAVAALALLPPPVEAVLDEVAEPQALRVSAAATRQPVRAAARVREEVTMAPD